MAINNVSVQYNRGLLPDSILLTLCDYIGNPFRYHKEFLSLQPVFALNYFDNFSPESGCSEGLDAFRSFLTNSLELSSFVLMSYLQTEHVPPQQFSGDGKMSAFGYILWRCYYL